MGSSESKDRVWIEYERLPDLMRFPRNPKDHDTDGIRESFERFGFIDPLIKDGKSGRMVAGHGRLDTTLGMKERGLPPPRRVQVAEDGEWLLPVLHGVAFENEDEAAAYVVANNRLVEKGGWNDDLAPMLQRVGGTPLALKGVGFTAGDLAALIGGKRRGLDLDEDVPAAPATPRSRLGELYQLGPHRLVCGDATIEADVGRVIAGVRVEMVFTDPPYGIDYEGAAGKLANDALDPVAFEKLLRESFARARWATKEGGACYVCHADTFGELFRRVFRETGWRFAAPIIWAKNAATLGRSDYHWRHEPILYGWNPGAAHRFRGDRTQTTVWEYPKPSRSELHPTMKPIDLVARAIENSSERDDAVLDLFGGSGSTLLACAKTGRRACLVELTPSCCDVIRARWTAYARDVGIDPGPDALELPVAGSAS